MKITMNRRKMMVILVLLGLVTFWSQPAGAVQKVKFGITHGHDLYFFPGFVAKDKGFWKANGVEIQTVYFKGAGDVITAAGAGKIKLGTAPSQTIAMAVMRGAPLKMVSARALTGKSMCVIARKEIKSWKDMKGKKIGITRFGGGLDFRIRKSALSVGLDPKKDMSILPLGGLSANEAAFLTERTDAFGWTLDVAKKFEKKYGTNTIFFRLSIPSGIFAHIDLIKEEADLVRRVLRAWYQASRYMKENPEYTIKAMVAQWGGAEEDIREFYMETIDDLSLDGTFPIESLNNAIEALKMMPKVKEEDIPSIEDFFTPQFLPVM